MSETISETIQDLHTALKDYIEATYHISDPHLILQRKRLLDRPGNVHQSPYLESTPRYRLGRSFADITGLSAYALEAFTALARADTSGPRILYDPPYTHQSDAIAESLVGGKNLIVMTGTGSGKTESFLLPILGKLASEAGLAPASFERPAMRALLLYPMNALVNDQLGRLRTLFGDPRLVRLFQQWAGRPARFARYTSRTPYAGVRDSRKDSRKLQAFDDFYVELERASRGGTSEEQAAAAQLIRQLKERGKWPAKPDLVAWFGQPNTPWQNRRTREFIRAVMLNSDTELLTRHEAQSAPPDLLVTNYSMLEYMLMRPIERPIFDATRDWLVASPNQKFLVVIDEAHLYRGSSGAEVGLLLRRLRDRLQIPPERFQVICATASFSDPDYAREFGAQLSGTDPASFVPITGTLDLKPNAATGSDSDARALAAVDLRAFHDAADNEEVKLGLLAPLLAYLGRRPSGSAAATVYEALREFPPLCLAINDTMAKALPLEGLGQRIFPNSAQETADAALTSLLSLASLARPEPHASGLLPCRIHNFFRGLPGLWACLDPDCSELEDDEKSGICGKLYGQPIERCACGSRVFELYTCRFCGTAYARAYTDDVDSPSALWSQPGRRLRIEGGDSAPLFPLDILLEQPSPTIAVEPATIDILTGQLNPASSEGRQRSLYIRHDRITPPADDEGHVDPSAEARGQFIPCACCGERGRFGKSTVQDHQTKGDQPFQALVARQIRIQPPSPVPATRFAPLRGRKVLVFSDSRQVAARLAPNLQMYSTRDSLRPLIIWGFRHLQHFPNVRANLSLDDLFLAVLIASKKLGVRLRPELGLGETFTAEDIIEAAVKDGKTDNELELAFLMTQMRSERMPLSLLDDVYKTVQDPFLGLEALALASIVEQSRLSATLRSLPAIPGLAEDDDSKLSLARTWLRCWRRNGFWLAHMPPVWWKRPSSQGVSIKGQRARFEAMKRVIKDRTALRAFNDTWHPQLISAFCDDVSGEARLRGVQLSLAFDGPWVRCADCKSVYRPIPTVHHCVECEGTNVAPLDPWTDTVFRARKGYYRLPTELALGQPSEPPMAIIAAEHTAQLNAPQNEDVFSTAELHELLFQDISPAIGRSRNTAIDVLSSTTTMEVGIDIGALSGVALRNMPPARANYQQRAGRAGRRANAVATVVAFGSADSHDERYFSDPAAMISGDVVDPRLTLENPDIARRHIRAFLLQNYHQDRLPRFDPSQPADLFSVLGTVESFRSAAAPLNRDDFAAWLSANAEALRERISAWLPHQLSAADKGDLLADITDDCLKHIDDAILYGQPLEDEASAGNGDDDADSDDETAEENDPRPNAGLLAGNLLDRLLYCGVLPRYAFPTDVANFNVFDPARSTRFRPVMKFAPSQGLPIALSQYAPGKQIWIAGKCYSSGALYSVMSEDRFIAWSQKRRIYRECSSCGYADTAILGTIAQGDSSDCPACGTRQSFGPARNWLRPPGFVHPIDWPEVTSPDDMPETSYATRAKLVMSSPPDETRWTPINHRLKVLSDRPFLLVSNTGPRKEGYTYCTRCGRIEATTEQSPLLFNPHRKPFVDDREPDCLAGATTRNIVLGTDFVTDIALFSLSVDDPVRLRPGTFPTDVALRTVSEALAKAACEMLEVEPSELLAEYRPALTRTDEGRNGLKAEIFIYDTLSGGGGFASQLVGRGKELFARALALMEHCPEQCDVSCYRCLRSFKNKFEHSLLDRHVGIQLLTYLLGGSLPAFDKRRMDAAHHLLLDDLVRQPTPGVAVQHNIPVRTTVGATVLAPLLATLPNGVRSAIAVSGPLTESYPADPQLLSLSDEIPLILVNELLVRGNLAAATRAVRSRLLNTT